MLTVIHSVFGLFLYIDPFPFLRLVFVGQQVIVFPYAEQGLLHVNGDAQVGVFFLCHNKIRTVIGVYRPLGVWIADRFRHTCAAGVQHKDGS